MTVGFNSARQIRFVLSSLILRSFKEGSPPLHIRDKPTDLSVTFKSLSRNSLAGLGKLSDGRSSGCLTKKVRLRHHEFPEIDRTSQQAASLKRTQTVVRHLGARTRVIQIDPQEDVEEIESQIAAKTKIAQDKFYLICMGRVLQPGACPADYGISRDSTLIMTGRLLCSRT